MQILDYLKNSFNINLNEQQRQAIITDRKNVVLLAVPGSGKTTVLVSRIAYLIIQKGISYDNILTLTFSRESARDMKMRYEKLFSAISNSIPRFSTIHSFCYSVLKEYSRRYNREMPKLLEGNNDLRLTKSKLLRGIYNQIKQEYLADDMLENIVNDISYYKNMMLNKNNYYKYLDTDSSFIDILEKYEAIKKEYKLMDYDDMLIYALDILKKLPQFLLLFKNKYKYINIDEAQDTSKLQYEIVKLFSDTANFFVVGDEDQCIYTFRGAYPDGLLNFSKDYKNTTVLKIEQNYRSNSDIVLKANDFIKANKNRYNKEMFTNNNKSNSINIIELDDYNRQYDKIIEDLKKIDDKKTVGILYRNNESAIPLIDAFKHNNIDYYVKEKNMKFFSSGVISDIFAYFTLVYDPKNIEAFEKIYYKCKCSKSVFLFAKYRIKDFSSVFEASANCPDVSIYQAKYLMKCHNSLEKLKNKQPFYAIQKIENDFGYKEYLSMKIKKGMNPLNPILKLNILKMLSKKYNTIHDFVERVSVLEKDLGSSKKNESNITLSSIHSAKGLEFDIVYFVDFIDSVIPSLGAIEQASDEIFDEMESERRLFYVALTRAKDKLIIYKSKFCNDEYVVKSRFITIIEDKKIVNNQKQSRNITVKLKGKEINHRMFGKGIVLTDSINDVFKVRFKEYGEKSLSYSICLKNGDLIDLK